MIVVMLTDILSDIHPPDLTEKSLDVKERKVALVQMSGPILNGEEDGEQSGSFHEIGSEGKAYFLIL